jgi:hypothetical protein
VAVKSRYWQVHNSKWIQEAVFPGIIYRCPEALFRQAPFCNADQPTLNARTARDDPKRDIKVQVKRIPPFALHA